MAKTVWTRKQDLVAFEHGREAALQGRARIATLTYETYNERAAFNDGWDSVCKLKPRVPKFKRPPRPSLGFSP